MRPLPYRFGLLVLPLLACSYAGGADTEGPASESTTAPGTTGFASVTASDDTGAPTTTTGAEGTTDASGPASSSTTSPVDPTGGEEETTGLATTGLSDPGTTGGATTSEETGGDSDTDTSSGTIDVPPGCENGSQDGDETDIDCGGGSCPACGESLTCLSDQDCASVHCVEGVCIAPTCEDAIANGGESDVDCGGPDCPACDDGLSCDAPGDCLSEVCTDQICQPPACDDGQKNASETDLDCGGPDCDACDDGQACLVPADCASATCEGELCVPASCDDGAQNGQETGVDCGGPSCAPCQLQSLVINEVDYDQNGDDLAEFIEIYNNTGAAVPLQGLAVVLVNGNDNKVYRTVDLGPGGTLEQGGYLVVAGPNFVAPPGAIKISTPAPAAGFIQNGSPDGVALIDTGAGALLDALSYEGTIIAAILPFGTASLVEGAALPAAVIDSAGGSLSRLPNGNDKNDAASDWQLSDTPTPGAANLP